MSDLLPFTLDDQIAAVQREIAMRKVVYPRRVEAQKMSPNKMNFEIKLMEAVLKTLSEVKARKLLE